MQKGYKLHAVWAGGPLPLAWVLARDERQREGHGASHHPELPGGGYLLGDPEFDCNALFDLAHKAEHQLLTPKRQKGHGLGHRPQSPYRLRSIELMRGRFGKSLYLPLSPSNRKGFREPCQLWRRVGMFAAVGSSLSARSQLLHAKILVNAARWFRTHPELLAHA